MRKSFFKLSLCLILSSTTTLAGALPQNKKIDPLECMNRGEKEQLDIALIENDFCHAALKAATVPPPNETTWETYALIFAGGIVLGYVVRH